MEGAVYIKKMLGAQTTTRVLSPYREEIGDDELSVLPRHTKVVVTGNNRTKSVLVGLQGVVKKAVGLGGWHWLSKTAVLLVFCHCFSICSAAMRESHLSNVTKPSSFKRFAIKKPEVLKNGVEVKLQRNALSVLEHPTGQEVDDDDDHGFENSCSSTDTDEKDDEFSGSMMFHKQQRGPRVRLPKPPLLSMQRPASKMNYRDNSHSQFNVDKHQPQPKVNLAILGIDSLRRYLKHFNIPLKNPDATKDEMVDAVQHHFMSLKVNEDEVIVDFSRAAKKLRPNK
ncbi:hypothetical protein C5167_004615 [Papaver somniferum]|uniref:Histone deacetylase complex subunit SAP30 Sin3 binding domain-containing protein n=1 Tax=Papaver somniferum TaxID=3469 RepID=A0A4Y7JBZ5_PAPSO|nr:hypothetical protein C5167_004615 [Papaver somniferum]